jgi:hypothetical protein
MTLDKINLVISTVCREENYLAATLDSLSSEYPIRNNQIVSLIVGSPVTTHLDHYRLSPGINVVEMGPNTWSWIKDRPTLHRATWNYYRCLTYPIAGGRGTLVLEDDIRFAHGWRARLDCTLKVLEEKYSSTFVLALYAPLLSARKERRPGQLYVEYPYNTFIGAQGIYYPAEVRLRFARYLKVHGVVANETHYDLLLRDYLARSSVPLLATSPCLIQHIGKASVIQNFWHESSDFVEDVTAEMFGLP